MENHLIKLIFILISLVVTFSSGKYTNSIDVCIEGKIKKQLIKGSNGLREKGQNMRANAIFPETTSKM